MIYYHGGPAGLNEILPPHVTGVLMHGEKPGPPGLPVRPWLAGPTSKVYVTTDLKVAEHMARFKRGCVYEVIPRGVIAGPLQHLSAYTCDSAEIISVVWEFRRNGEG